MQTREPAAIEMLDRHAVIPLSNASVEDTGHALFHSSAGGHGLACASCHPEGGDDGRVWLFTAEGMRRTQNLAGGVMGTAPFHWDGAFGSMQQLTTEVLGHRMGGTIPSRDQQRALELWIDKIPIVATAITAPSDAVARGRALFEDPAVGCASCHVGSQGTNNATVSVGTGGPLQVPRLVGLASHPPYLHNGCAATLRDRFGPCGGGDAHGHTSQLTEAQIDDLVAYLSTR